MKKLNISRVLSTTLLAPAILTGCANSIMPTDHAPQVDFVTMYISSLSAKYKEDTLQNHTQLNKKLQEYDALPSQSIVLIEQHQQRNRYIKDEFESEIKRLTEKNTRLQKSIKEIKQEILVQQVQSKSMEKTKEQLSKKFKGTVLIEKEEQEELKIQGITLRITLSKNELEAQEKDLESLQTKLSQTTGDLNKINLFDPVEDRRRKIRDEIVKDFMAIADSFYINFKNELLSGKVQTDTISDISELLLSTATTLTGGITAKANLGAASTLLKGSRSTIDKNFFAQQTMRAIINVMEDGRQRDQLAIINRLEKSTSEYPLSQAISDVQRYQSRANLFTAVLDIANQTGVNAEKSADQLRQK